MSQRVYKTIRTLSAALAVAFCISGCSLAATLFQTAAPQSGVYISEVVSSNSNSLIDDEFGNPDWVEIHNASDGTIGLKGYALSTARGGGNRYDLPDISLEAGGYLVIYCCPSPDDLPEGKYCTGFKLSKSGTNLFLLSSNAVVQELAVPQLETDISYGVDADGVYKFMTSPTPGAANASDTYETLAELASQQSAQLRISEVLPKSLDGTEAPWVEIMNAGQQAVELSGYCITDNLSNPTKARLPQKSLAAWEYAVFHFTDDARDGQVPFKLGSGDNSLTLSNNLGVNVDAITWDKDIFPGFSAGRGGDDAVRYYEQPTPGAENGRELEDADFTLKEGAGTVRINEILVDNTFSLIDEDGERPAWMELYNTSGEVVSLRGCTLSDDKQDIWKWVFPDIAIQPESYLIVYLSGKDRKGEELHANFRVGSSDECLTFTQPRAHTVQTAALPEEKKDNVSYGLDGDGAWLHFPQPTPGAENTTKGFTDIAAAQTGASPLRINEVLAANAARSSRNDWVEIYNGASKTVNLAGYSLSDTDKDLKKWPIGAVKIKANGYAVIDSYKNGKSTGDLTISANSGERLYLSDPQGVVLDEFDTGVLRAEYSSGVAGEEEARAVFKNPTPGKKNGNDTLQGYCAAPVFSEQGGFESEPVMLAMTTTTSGAQIYYTLDGSKPSVSSKKYAGPIKITSSKTVRAVACAKNRLSSDETGATYLFEKKHELPVICLSISESDKKYVFGSPDRKVKRERAGYVEYYESDGTLGVRFPAGFAIMGNGTRHYAQRSINLYLRSAYGKSAVTYPFFEDFDITTFKSLTLRNAGQDAGFSRMRDAYFGMVTKGMQIEYMEARFCAVYINAKYWGLYEFKENQNEDYLAARHGIDPDKVEFVRGNTFAYKGNSRNIKNLFSLAKRNTADDAVFKQYTALADEAYFTDYLIAQTYFCNSDFYNQKYTHTTDNKLKWRPLLYDLDWCFIRNNARRSILSSFFRPGGVNLGEPTPGGTQNKSETMLFYAFYRNKAWRERFIERYAEVLNTIMTTEKMLARFDEMADSIREEMPRHIKRWGRPSSVSSWEKSVKNLRECIKDRRKYVIESLQDFFNLSDKRLKELFPNG